MNELNYASLEASKKLVDNGIVLDEVDFMWFERETEDWILIPSDSVSIKAFQDGHAYPAPCFTEVWRELPEGTVCKKQPDGITKAYTDEPFSNLKVMFNTNPTDALIELLIWAKGEKK